MGKMSQRFDRLTCCLCSKFSRSRVLREALGLFLVIISVCRPLGLTELGAQELSSLRNAPNGYTWIDCHSGQIALLKPVHWFFREDINTSMECFLTKEKLNINKKFSSGVSVSIKPKFRAIQKLAPREYAKRFALLTAQRVEELKGRVNQTWEETHDSFKIYGIEYSRANSIVGGQHEVESIRVRQLSIGNDENDTFILIIFESPRDDWEMDWKIAEPVLSQLGFNPGSSD